MGGGVMHGCIVHYLQSHTFCLAKTWVFHVLELHANFEPTTIQEASQVPTCS
jgi:hypothetical protein